MLAFLEKLLEWLWSTWRQLLPWVILHDDEVGLIRRLGCYHRNTHHGWNWKWPVLEAHETAVSALDSTVLREQSLVTSDNTQVTLRGVVTYRVVDPRKYILDVATAESVLNDALCSVLSEVVPQHTAKRVLRDPEFSRELLKKVRQRAKRWGVEVDSVGLADRTTAKTYRVITSAPKDVQL